MISYVKNIFIHSPKGTLVMSLLFCAFIASGLRWFIIDDDFFKMFPKNLDSRLLWEDMIDEFGDSEFLFIAFGEEGKSVYNINTMNKVREVTSYLEDISIVDRVISLSTIDKIEVDPEDDTWLNVDKLFSDNIINSNDIESARKYLNDNSDIRDRLISNDETFTAIVVRSSITTDDGEFRNNSVLMNQVTPIVNKYLSEYNVHYAGNPYITGEAPKLIQADAMRLMVSGIFIMIFLLYMNIRNFKAVAMILAVIILSVISMNGFMGWLFYLTGHDFFNFTIINTSMLIVLLTIANSDGVHIITHFFKQIRIDKDKKHAITNTMNSLRLPIFLTSLTTIIAFLAMIYSPIPQMMGYGLCISFGIFWAWFLSNTFLPSVILMTRWPDSSTSQIHMGLIERSVRHISKLIFKSPKKTLFIGVSFVFIGLVGISLVKVEVNIIKFFKKGNPIRESTEFVDQNFSGTMSLLMRVHGDMKDPATLETISSIQNHIETHKEVKMTLSASDMIKQMHKTLYNSDDYYTIPDSKGKISNLMFMAPSDQLRTVVNTTGFKSGMIHSYLISLSTDEIVGISKEIDSFVSSEVPDSIKVESSGLMILLRDFVSLVISSSIISIAVSIIAIFIITLIFFRGFIWGFMSVLPLISAVILNFGLMGIFGVKLSHITALLTSIIIGVGVDFAVHYISSFKRALARGDSTSSISMKTMDDVGYPILLDVVSNMGFAALLFSDLIPLNYMGGLMIFAMLSTSFGTFILMGTTMEIIKNKL